MNNPQTYRYWDSQTKSIDFEGMCEDLRRAPENSVIILHACAHNPTGCDPTKEQWKELAQIIEVTQHLNLFYNCLKKRLKQESLQ